MEDTQAFIFFRSWLDAVELMNDDEELAYYRAIISYAFHGVITNDITAGVKMAMKFVSVAIDSNKEKREQIVEKRREAIRKRWDKQKNTNVSNEIQNYTNDTNVYFESQENTEEYKPYYNVNVNVNDNVNVDNNMLSINNTTLSKDNIVKSTSETDIDPKDGKIGWKQLMDVWNDTMEGKAISQIKSITEERKKAVIARATQHGTESIIIAIDKVAESSFLNGDNDRNFIATFDWVFKKANFQKILEGNYDDRKPKKKEANKPQYYEIVEPQEQKGNVGISARNIYLKELKMARDGNKEMRAKYPNWIDLCKKVLN